MSGELPILVRLVPSYVNLMIELFVVTTSTKLSLVELWWTIEAAIAEAVPVEVLASALFARFRSRQDHTFAEKVLSAMRFKFGGHVERAAGG